MSPLRGWVSGRPWFQTSVVLNFVESHRVSAAQYNVDSNQLNSTLKNDAFHLRTPALPQKGREHRQLGFQPASKADSQRDDFVAIEGKSMRRGLALVLAVYCLAP